MVQAQLSSRPASGIDQTITSEGPLLPAPAFANIPARGFMDPDVLDAQTAFFVRFLDVLHDTDAVRTSHRRTVDLLGVQDGFHLLDVGCGTGNFTREVAPLVGQSGRLVGIDLSRALIGVARHRAVDLDLAIDFCIGDAQELPFADATFDGCRIERVLQYLDDPRRALTEMVRVTKPGGHIVAAEVDWDTFTNDLPNIDRDVYRRVIRTKSNSAGNGWMGRELRRHLLDLALDDVTSEGFVVINTDAATVLDDLGSRLATQRVRDAGAISAEDCADLIEAEEAAGRAGRYFAAFSLFVASGQKPLP